MKPIQIDASKTKSPKKVSRWRKILAVLLGIVAVGIAYESVSRWLDMKTHPPLGRLVQVNGRDMHVFASGAGDATVVFAAGWKVPSPYVDFYPLWHTLEKQARVVVYDRPGYGWSDEVEAPRDVDRIAGEIHELLEKSGEKPPYVLVGHSIGALEVIRYAQMYPGEVKGVVLLDGSNPDMYTNGSMPPPSQIANLRFRLSNAMIYLANRTGLSRVLFAFGLYDSTPLVTAREGLAGLPANLRQLDAALFLRTFQNQNQIDEGDRKERNAARTASQGYLRMPLTILCSQALRDYAPTWQNQLALREWSSHSKLITVDGTGHALHWNRPEVVVQAIRAHLDESLL